MNPFKFYNIEDLKKKKLEFPYKMIYRLTSIVINNLFMVEKLDKGVFIFCYGRGRPSGTYSPPPKLSKILIPNFDIAQIDDLNKDCVNISSSPPSATGNRIEIEVGTLAWFQLQSVLSPFERDKVIISALSQAQKIGWSLGIMGTQLMVSLKPPVHHSTLSYCGV